MKNVNEDSLLSEEVSLYLNPFSVQAQLILLRIISYSVTHNDLEKLQSLKQASV